MQGVLQVSQTYFSGKSIRWCVQYADDIFVEEVGANIRFDPLTRFHVRCHKQPRPFCENFPTTHGFKPVALFQLCKFEDNAVVLRSEVRHGRMHVLYLNRQTFKSILFYFFLIDLLRRLWERRWLDELRRVPPPCKGIILPTACNVLSFCMLQSANLCNGSSNCLDPTIRLMAPWFGINAET